MHVPLALRRIALGSTAAAGVALLGFAFHGMAGLDARLALIAEARDAVPTQMVVRKSAAAAPQRDCDKLRERADDAPAGAVPEPVAPIPSGRDY